MPYKAPPLPRLLALLTVAAACMAHPVQTAAQLQTSRLTVKTLGGVRTSTMRTENLLGEPVERVRQHLDLVLLEATYRRSDELSLRARYQHGIQQSDPALGALNLLREGYYIGGAVTIDAYAGAVEYGYQSGPDSVNVDVLWTEHRLRLPNGLVPAVSSWIGIGDQDYLGWILRGSLRLPLHEQIDIEPLLMLSENGVSPDKRLFIGAKAHISLFEKGRLTLGFSRRMNAGNANPDHAAVITSHFPFGGRHQLNLSIQRNTSFATRSTLVALGTTLGLGRS